MTDWQLVCLAVMAASLAVMAGIQIGLILIGVRLAKQAATMLDELRREVRPLIEKANRIADEAARATSLAALQVERVDQMMSTTAARVEEAVGIVQAAFGGPVRQGAAVVLGIRAVLAALRRRKRRGRANADDEDALFVG